MTSSDSDTYFMMDFFPPLSLKKENSCIFFVIFNFQFFFVLPCRQNVSSHLNWKKSGKRCCSVAQWFTLAWRQMIFTTLIFLLIPSCRLARSQFLSMYYMHTIPMSHTHTRTHSSTSRRRKRRRQLNWRRQDSWKITRKTRSLRSKSCDIIYHVGHLHALPDSCRARFVMFLT